MTFILRRVLKCCYSLWLLGPLNDISRCFFCVNIWLRYDSKKKFDFSFKFTSRSVFASPSTLPGPLMEAFSFRFFLLYVPVYCRPFRGISRWLKWNNEQDLFRLNMLQILAVSQYSAVMSIHKCGHGQMQINCGCCDLRWRHSHMSWKRFNLSESRDDFKGLWLQFMNLQI